MGSVAAETTGEAQLYERHSQLVYRYCRRMMGTREDAEDAAQTTFFQALRALRRGVVPSFEQAWLLSIARNECKSRHRAGSRRRRRELAHDPQSLAELAEAPDGGDGRLVGVREALARLPEMQRRALLLREWQGRSYADIAHELGATRPAVEALLYRARRGLARELGEERAATRRHAFDLASLFGALKSFLGGSAALKVAAGVAAVATVGTVAPSSRREAEPMIGVKEVSARDRPVSARVHSRSVAPALRPEPQVRKSLPSSKRAAFAQRSEPPPSAKAPAAAPMEHAPSPATPAPPPMEHAPSLATPAPPPVTPPAQAPSTPAVPDVPVPQTPQLPAVSPAPPVPQGNVPEVPQVPAVPTLTDVPDVPLLSDVPSLP